MILVLFSLPCVPSLLVYVGWCFGGLWCGLIITNSLLLLLQYSIRQIWYKWRQLPCDVLHQAPGFEPPSQDWAPGARECGKNKFMRAKVWSREKLHAYQGTRNHCSKRKNHRVQLPNNHVRSEEEEEKGSSSSSSGKLDWEEEERNSVGTDEGGKVKYSGMRSYDKKKCIKQVIKDNKFIGFIETKPSLIRHWDLWKCWHQQNIDYIDVRAGKNPGGIVASWDNVSCMLNDHTDGCVYLANSFRMTSWGILMKSRTHFEKRVTLEMLELLVWENLGKA